MWAGLLVLLISFVGLLYIYLKLVKWTFWNKYKHAAPILEPTFPFGSLSAIFTKSESLCDGMTRKADECGRAPVALAYNLHNPMVYIHDPEIAKQIMVKDFDAFVDRQSSKLTNMVNSTNQKADQLMQRQMIIASGDKWKKLRTTFTPIFTSGKMKAMMVFINDACDRLNRAMDKIADSGEAFEAKSLLGKFSMDTIASCAFGLDANVHATDKSIFVQYANEIFRSRVTDAMKFLVLILPGGKYVMRAFGWSVQPKKETEFFYEIVLRTMKQRKESGVRRNDLIDMMMDAIRGDITGSEHGDEDQFDKDAKLNPTAASPSVDNPLSKSNALNDDDVFATAFVIMVAGYDTTGSLLAFASYQLAKNPEIQERLRQEVEDVIGMSDQLKYEDVQKMNYMDQVLSETLRMYTPLAMLQRVAGRDYKIPGSEVTVPKGCDVWINAAGIHTDPKHFPDPYNFDPERFSKENSAKRHPFAFLSFGQGPRGCIGRRFALLEAKLAMAQIITRYNILPSEKTAEPVAISKSSIITYAQDGLFIKLERRHGIN